MGYKLTKQRYPAYGAKKLMDKASIDGLKRQLPRVTLTSFCSLRRNPNSLHSISGDTPTKYTTAVYLHLSLSGD